MELYQKLIVEFVCILLNSSRGWVPKLRSNHNWVLDTLIRGNYYIYIYISISRRKKCVKKIFLKNYYLNSRCKVKFNVHKSDNMIIQSIALLDQLDKDVNTFSMRIREWYSYHFPELIKIVPDNYTFAKCVKLIKNRKELTDDGEYYIITYIKLTEKMFFF